MQHPCKQDGKKRQSVIKQMFERKHLVNWRTQIESLIHRWKQPFPVTPPFASTPTQVAKPRRALRSTIERDRSTPEM
jgi:hypothetical protein